MIKDFLKTAFDKSLWLLTGAIPADQRILPDFAYPDGEGGFYNHLMSIGLDPERVSEGTGLRIDLTLNDLDAIRDELSAYEFVAKLGHNSDQNTKGSHPYSLYLYPIAGRDTIQDLYKFADDFELHNSHRFDLPRPVQPYRQLAS